MLYFHNPQNASSPYLSYNIRPDIINNIQKEKDLYFQEEFKKLGDSTWQIVSCNPQENNLISSHLSASGDQKQINRGKRKAEIYVHDNEASRHSKKPKLTNLYPNSKQAITLNNLTTSTAFAYQCQLNKINSDYVPKSIDKLKHILEQPSTSNKSIGALFLEKLNERIITVLSSKPPEDKFDLDDFFKFLNPVPTVMCLWKISLVNDKTMQTITTLRQRMPALLFYYWLGYYIQESLSGNYWAKNFSSFMLSHIDKQWHRLTSESILFGLKNIPAEKFQAAIWYLNLGKDISEIQNKLLFDEQTSTSSIVKCKHTLFNIAGLQGFLDITNQSLSAESRRVFDEIKQEYDDITSDIPLIEAMHFDNTDLQQEMPYTNGCILKLAQNKHFYS
jgi:hypothetical protein